MPIFTPKPRAEGSSPSAPAKWKQWGKEFCLLTLLLYNPFENFLFVSMLAIDNYSIFHNVIKTNNLRSYEVNRSDRTHCLVPPCWLLFYALFPSEKGYYSFSVVSGLYSSRSPGCISSSLQNASMFSHDTGLPSLSLL